MNVTLSELFFYIPVSRQAVRANLQEALKVAAGTGSESEKMEAQIEADVYQAIQHALAK